MTVLFRCLALLLLLLPVARGARAAEATKEEALALAQKVHDVFEAKCLDCHGPELPRPKKFGYVLDLQRMADNPEYVERGHPENSELYKMVFNDEMPGENANVPPLTKEEKESVRRWVEIGAPATLPGSTARPAPPISNPTALQPKEPFLRKFFRWIGQFHPASTHFPVALMFVAVFAETIAWYTKRPSWFETVRFLVILAALGAVGATILGWLNAYFSSYNKAFGALLWWHRWSGTLSGVWAVVCAALLLGDTREGSRTRLRFRGALIFGAALVGLSGFLGAALLYGLDHYAWR